MTETIIIGFDATLIALAYKAGLEDGFELAVDTTEIEKELNLNNIDTPDE